MKQIIAQYNGDGIRISCKKDEIYLRNQIIAELSSLYRQRKHWLLSSMAHKLWVHSALANIDLFLRQYSQSPLTVLCAKILQYEGSFSLILPHPSGKQGCRYETFQFILTLSKAILNDRSKNLPGQR